MAYKVGITGYTGFVGSEICKQLKEHELVCIGRKAPEQNFEHIYAEFESEKTDLATSLHSIDVIIHSAARVHIMNENATEQEKLEAYRLANKDFTLHIATEAEKAGVRRFIFISSIKVNGEQTYSEKFTADDDRNPHDAYAISKSETEVALLECAKNWNMDVVIIRPPLVYGAGVKANFAALCKLVLKKYPLPFGLIKNNKRSLVFVKNLANLVEVCLDHKNAGNQIFLVSDDNDVSTARLVTEIASAAGIKPILLPIPEFIFKLIGKLTGKTEQVERLVGSLELNITKTKQLLNWEPPYSLSQGLLNTLKENAID